MMKKALVLVTVAILLAGVVSAAGNYTRTKKENPPASPGVSPIPPIQMIDYYNPGTIYTWSGNMYMSNLFKPNVAWYPLDILALEVFPARLDGNTATGVAGVLNGIAVFDTTMALLARQLNAPATVGQWNLITFTTPVIDLAAGNFYGGMWNDTADGGFQGTATNWAAPPTEPFECVTAGTAATAGGAGPWVGNGCGASYGTVSAAAVRAQVNSVPVELMRFDVE